MDGIQWPHIIGVRGDGAQRSESRSPCCLMLWPKISHIFRMGRPTKFKRGIPTEYDDLHHRCGQWPPSWKLWVSVADQFTICEGQEHIVVAPLQAAQLVYTVALLYHFHSFSLCVLLPRDAMCKHGLCCGPLSVCLSHLCILSRQLKISSNFLVGLVAPSFYFFDPWRRYPIPPGTPSAGGGRKMPGGGKILWFSTEISIYLGNGTR